MNEQPKVSVIMPSLNVVQYIDQCVESVLAQTLQNIEIISVDAHSTDGTLEKLQAYAERDPRFHLLLSDKKSYGYQMNIGIAAATGEYIGIVETDDWAAPEMYEELAAIADREQLDFVKADYDEFTTHPLTGAERRYRRNLTENAEAYNKVFDPSQDPAALDYVMHTSAGIYRRAFLQEHGIRHNETPGASYQDNGFFIQTFAYATRAMLVNRSYYRYRIDNPGSSIRSREKVYDMNREYALIRERLTQDPEVWERYKGAYWKRAYISYIVTWRRIAPEFKAEFARTLHEEFAGAQERGELDLDLFDGSRRQLVELLVRDPDAFLEKMTALDLYREYSLPSRIRVLENKKKALERKRDFLERKAETLAARNAEQKKELRHDADVIRSLRKKISVFRKKNTAMAQELRAIKRSRSYRIGRSITWPVRKLLSK